MDITDYLALLLVVANVLLVVVTLVTAWAAVRSANTAAAELRLARRPLVLASGWKASEFSGLAAAGGRTLTIAVGIEDTVGVPSIVHRAKIRSIEPPNLEGWQTEVVQRPVYKSLTCTLVTRVDIDHDAGRPGDLGAKVEVSCLFSAEADDRCQEWTCEAHVFATGDGFECFPTHAHFTRDDWREEHERRQYWRRIVRWWKEWWKQ